MGQGPVQNLEELPSQKRQRRLLAVGYSLGVMFTLALATTPLLPINHKSKVHYGLGLILVAFLPFLLIWGEYWHQQRETDIQMGFSADKVLRYLRQSGNRQAIATANEFERYTDAFHTCCMRLNLAVLVLLFSTVLSRCIPSVNPTVHFILHAAWYTAFGLWFALRTTSQRMHIFRKQLRGEALELCTEYESVQSVVMGENMFQRAPGE